MIEYLFIFIGIERPDVRQLGILSFATIVHNAFAAGQLSESSFDKYVKTYFNLFLGAKRLLDIIYYVSTNNQYVTDSFALNYRQP